MDTVTGRIHSIETFGAVDGPGIRYVLFLQGCPLRCQFCHNPDSWDFKGGTSMTVKEVMKDIKEYRSFIKRGGVTLSGGEPLAQPEFVLALLKECRKNGFHTAVDTSGAVKLAVSKPVIDAADMLLLDIKALDPALCKEITGKSNSNALDILNYCEKTGKMVWIRHVVIPGLTLDNRRLEELADFLKKYRCIDKIELLPFHKMGEYKWEVLKEKYRLSDTPEPTSEEMDRVTEIFSGRGLPV